MATVEWPGYNRLRAALATLADPDASALMRNWERIIVEGNRRGVLSGLDGNDQPMAPLKYRGGAAKATRNRKGPRFGANPKFSSLHQPTTREYQQMTGPRLAPQYANSRVIMNLRTGHGRDPVNRYQWFAVGEWDEVVNEKGVAFLPFHFAEDRGRAVHLPRYDLRPVRPADKRLAQREMVKWAKATVRAAIRG